MNVLYLHGFASSPASSKAVFFVDRLEEHGIPVTVPDLNEDDFEHLTVRRMLGTAQRLVDAMPRPRIIIGSSLGGYVAALCAASRDLDGLVLLAPAFDPVSRWTRQARPEDLERWRREGTWNFDHHALKRKLPLRYDFLDDARSHDPWPGAPIPTLVLQGTRDVVVPPDTAREYVEHHPHVVLREVDTDHEMLGAMPEMWTATENFLAQHGWLRKEASPA